MNCIQVEKEVFPHPKVREAFKSYVKVALYIPEPSDGQITEINDELYTRFANQESLPAYVLVDPNTGKVLDLFFYDREFIQDPGVFADRLNKAFRKWKFQDR